MAAPKFLPALLALSLVSTLAPATSFAALDVTDPTLAPNDPNEAGDPKLAAPSKAFLELITADSLAATSTVTTILVEQLAAYYAAGGTVEALRARQPLLADILALSLGEAPSASAHSGAIFIVAAILRRTHIQNTIAASYESVLPRLLPPGPHRSRAPEQWEAYLASTLGGGDETSVDVRCVDPACLRFDATLIDPDATTAEFTGSGPTFLRSNVEALVVGDQGTFQSQTAAAIIFRIRKRPDLLAAEFDEVIVEQIEMLESNPL